MRCAYNDYVRNCEACGIEFKTRYSRKRFCGSKECDIIRKQRKAHNIHLRRDKEYMRIKAMNGYYNNQAHHLEVKRINGKRPALYDTYAHQLLPVEDVRRNIDDSRYLEVKCTKCDKWFLPTTNRCNSRASYLRGVGKYENRFYCSDECKLSCSIRFKKKYPSYHKKSDDNNIVTAYELSTWSKEVLLRANYICGYCGSTATDAHHVLPKKTHSFFTLDPDNGIACCKECHYKYAHSSEECLPVNLALFTNC